MAVATELIVAIAITAVLSLLASWILNTRGRRTGFPVFFLTIFLFTLAGGLWLKPFGPMRWGIYWMPYIVIGVAGTILLYLLAPRRPPENREETIEMLDRMKERKELESLAYMTMNITLKVLLVMLAAAIVFHYFLRFRGS